MRTDNELYTELAVVGFDKIIIVDNDYMLPDVAYIADFGERFAGLLFNSRLTYAMDAFDCDDFSIFAAMLMRLDHAKANRNSMSSIACGFAHIILPSGGSHMCICAVHKINNELVVKLYEPQKQGNICLKEIPISGCQLLFVYI